LFQEDQNILANDPEDVKLVIGLTVEALQMIENKTSNYLASIVT